MKKAKLSLFAGIIAAGSMLAATQANALDRGEMLANTCVGCHGDGGLSNGPAIPSIAGYAYYPEESDMEAKGYFVSSMLNYRDAERPATIMNRIAKGYTDQDILDMAAYFAKQKHVAVEQKFDKKMALAGEKLHDKYCEKCHSEAGMNADDDAGFLGGQWKPYLHYNLTDFLSGDREMDKKMAKKLNSLYKKHGQEGIDELVEFYSSK
jgi:sulfide dehydrogenase cytochrome subunit